MKRNKMLKQKISSLGRLECLFCHQKLEMAKYIENETLSCDNCVPLTIRIINPLPSILGNNHYNSFYRIIPPSVYKNNCHITYVANIFQNRVITVGQTIYNMIRKSFHYGEYLQFNNMCPVKLKKMLSDDAMLDNYFPSRFIYA